MPSLYKLQREARRIGQHILGSPASAAEYLFGQVWHDHWLRRKTTRTPGDDGLGPKIAIYVIFPKYGLLKSHLDSIEYFRSNGYSVWVVSNIRLETADRQSLLKLCHCLIERENFGYDFGGYREGVFAVFDFLRSTDRLVLANDSCWFPLPGSTNWLSKAETSGLDYVGAATSKAVPHVSVERYDTITWNYDPNMRDFHYCSFALSLSKRLINDPAFMKFWKDFRLSNKKANTVRRGEIGLTKWAMRKGFSHGSIFDVKHLDQVLQELPRDELERWFDRLIVMDSPMLTAVIKQIGQQSIYRQTNRVFIEKVILYAVARLGMAYAIPEFLYEKYGYGFLKKTPVLYDNIALQNTITFVDRLPNGGGSIAREIERMTSGRTK